MRVEPVTAAPKDLFTDHRFATLQQISNKMTLMQKKRVVKVRAPIAAWIV